MEERRITTPINSIFTKHKAITMNYFLNTFEYDPFDDLTHREHLVLMMMDNADACAEAINHYLNFRPDREREFAAAYFNAHN